VCIVYHHIHDAFPDGWLTGLSSFFDLALMDTPISNNASLCMHV
jgi:hypothetical protein